MTDIRVERAERVVQEAERDGLRAFEDTDRVLSIIDAVRILEDHSNLQLQALARKNAALTRLEEEHLEENMQRAQKLAAMLAQAKNALRNNQMQDPHAHQHQHQHAAPSSSVHPPPPPPPPPPPLRTNFHNEYNPNVIPPPDQTISQHELRQRMQEQRAREEVHARAMAEHMRLMNAQQQLASVAANNSNNNTTSSHGPNTMQSPALNEFRTTGGNNMNRSASSTSASLAHHSQRDAHAPPMSPPAPPPPRPQKADATTGTTNDVSTATDAANDDDFDDENSRRPPSPTMRNGRIYEEQQQALRMIGETPGAPPPLPPTKGALQSYSGKNHQKKQHQQTPASLVSPPQQIHPTSYDGDHKKMTSPTLADIATAVKLPPPRARVAEPTKRTFPTASSGGGDDAAVRRFAAEQQEQQSNFQPDRLKEMSPKRPGAARSSGELLDRSLDSLRSYGGGSNNNQNQHLVAPAPAPASVMASTSARAGPGADLRPMTAGDFVRPPNAAARPPTSPDRHFHQKNDHHLHAESVRADPEYSAFLSLRPKHNHPSSHHHHHQQSGNSNSTGSYFFSGGENNNNATADPLTPTLRAISDDAVRRVHEEEQAKRYFRDLDAGRVTSSRDINARNQELQLRARYRHVENSAEENRMRQLEGRVADRTYYDAENQAPRYPALPLDRDLDSFASSSSSATPHHGRHHHHGPRHGSSNNQHMPPRSSSSSSASAAMIPMTRDALAQHRPVALPQQNYYDPNEHTRPQYYYDQRQPGGGGGEEEDLGAPRGPAERPVGYPGYQQHYEEQAINERRHAREQDVATSANGRKSERQPLRGRTRTLREVERASGVPQSRIRAANPALRHFDEDSVVPDDVDIYVPVPDQTNKDGSSSSSAMTTTRRAVMGRALNEDARSRNAHMVPDYEEYPSRHSYRPLSPSRRELGTRRPFSPDVARGIRPSEVREHRGKVVTTTGVETAQDVCARFAIPYSVLRHYNQVLDPFDPTMRLPPGINLKIAN